MRKLVFIAALLGAVPTTAHAFVYDGGVLPGGKADYQPQPNIPANKKIVADEWNQTINGIYDLRDAVAPPGGKFHALQIQPYGTAPINDGGFAYFVATEDAGAVMLEGVWPDGTRHSIAENPKVHQASHSVRYVSPNGDDSLDGLTWATAKKYVMSAVASIQGVVNAKIYVASGSFCRADGGGIWLGYTTAPNWVEPAANISIEGVGGDQPAFGRAGQAVLNCGNDLLPGIWVFGTEGGMRFENIAVTGPIYIGINPDTGQPDGLTANVWFHNIWSTGGDYHTTPKPALWLGQVFWVDVDTFGFNHKFQDCGQVGKTDCWDDQNAAVLLSSLNTDGGTHQGAFNPYIINIRHGVVNGGTIKIHANDTGSGQVVLDDITAENSSVPVVTVDENATLGGQGGNSVYASMINAADGNPMGIQVINSARPELVTVRNNGYGQLSGPMTILGVPAGHATYLPDSGSLEMQPIIGMNAFRGRYIGQIDDTRRSGAPRSFPFLNIADNVKHPSPYSSTYASGHLVAARGPYGSQNAVCIHGYGDGGSAPYLSLFDFDHNGALPVSTGDRVMIGMWGQGDQGNAGNCPVMAVGFGNMSTSSPFDASYNNRYDFDTRNGGEAGQTASQWKYWWDLIRVDQVTGSPTSASFASCVGDTGDFCVADPFIYIIPADAGYSDDELGAIFWNMIDTPDNVPPGMDTLPYATDFALQQHLHVKGDSPGADAGANAGTGATATLATGATDTEGTVVLVAGTGPSSGAMVAVTLVAPFVDGGVPDVHLSAADANAAGLGVPYPSEGASSWTLNSPNAPTSGQTYRWHYLLVGH